jgi:hypothetical protein
MPYPTRYFYSLLLNVCEGLFFFSILCRQDRKVGVPAELSLFSELTTCEKILIFNLVNDRKVEQVGSYTRERGKYLLNAQNTQKRCCLQTKCAGLKSRIFSVEIVNSGRYGSENAFVE